MPLVGLRTVCPHPSPEGKKKREDEIDINKKIKVKIKDKRHFIFASCSSFVLWSVSTHN